MTHLYGPVWGHKMIGWIESEDSLIAIDTGWDLALGESYLGSDVEALVQASLVTGKPLSHILLTHHHADHRLNLPFLLERWHDAEVCAHLNAPIDGITQPLAGGVSMEIGGERIEVLHTPGHSEAHDELSYYLPKHELIFCGDLLQPQGPSYSFANGPSPVPYFHDLTAYRASLERFAAMPLLMARSGHGDFLGPEQLKQWLRVTLATLTRIEELAISLTERYPDKEAEWLAELIYDQIADERHFGTRAANQRKRQSSYSGATDYERFDRPGLLDAVRQAQAIL